MSYPTTLAEWLQHSADLENTLECALDNGWDDGQATFGPFDEFAEQGLVFVLHDGFLTVGFEGDSDTLEIAGLQNAAIATKAVDAMRSLVEAYA